MKAPLITIITILALPFLSLAVESSGLDTSRPWISGSDGVDYYYFFSPDGLMTYIGIANKNSNSPGDVCQVIEGKWKIKEETLRIEITKIHFDRLLNIRVGLVREYPIESMSEDTIILEDPDFHDLITFEILQKEGIPFRKKKI